MAAGVDAAGGGLGRLPQRWQLRGGPGRVGRGGPPRERARRRPGPDRPGRRPTNDPGRPDPARRDRLRRAEPRPGRPRHPPERPRPGRGRPARRDARRARLAGVELAALYCGPGESVVRTAEAVGKALGLRPRRIDDLRNLDQGLWQGLQLDEIKRRQRQGLPPVARRPGHRLPPAGRDGRRARWSGSRRRSSP